MSHHVTICKIQTDKITLFFDFGYTASFTSNALISGFRSYVATLGEGISIRLSFSKGSSSAAGKEKCYMPVFFGFCYPQLFFPALETSSPIVFDKIVLVKHNLHPLEGVVIPCHCNVMQMAGSSYHVQENPSG
jgi:hypothetical protein